MRLITIDNKNQDENRRRQKKIGEATTISVADTFCVNLEQGFDCFRSSALVSTNHKYSSIFFLIKCVRARAFELKLMRTVARLWMVTHNLYTHS